MRKARVLLILLLLALGSVGFYVMYSGWLAPERNTVQQQAVNQPASEPARPQAEPAEDEQRPSFDIVRAESDGSVVMAGRSPPEWTVIVESNGQEIARKRADAFGEWVIDDARKLTQGQHSLELSAVAPDGGKTLFSTQRLALSMSAPADGQPLVALTEEGKPTRVLQMPPPRSDAPLAANMAAPDASGEQRGRADDVPTTAPIPVDPGAIAEAASLIGFASVDFEDAGEKSMLFMNGHAKPDSRVALFVNDQLLGTVKTDATGSWNFSGNRWLSGGRHTLRADLLAEKVNPDADDKAIARAEVHFERTPQVVSALQDEDRKFPASGYEGDQGQQASASSTGAALARPAGSESPAEPRIIVIQNGDTLWQIAQRHYGDGAKYTQIFRNNRAQIRDPNWIYPEQRLQLP
ncbi:MAG: LysM peptidoglycan-binding domain-containing protein [Rhodomicrobiaceae bacterium]